MAKRKKPTKRKVKLTVDDAATRKAFATWLDEGIKSAENAIDQLKEGLTKESAGSFRGSPLRAYPTGSQAAQKAV